MPIIKTVGDLKALLTLIENDDMLILQPASDHSYVPPWSIYVNEVECIGGDHYEYYGPDSKTPGSKVHDALVIGE